MRPRTICTALLLIGLTHVAGAKEPALVFLAGDQSIAELDTAELAEVSGRNDFHLYDAMHKKQKYFAGIPLLELLGHAYGDALFQEDWSSIAFIAEDGYEAVASFSVAGEEGAVLVYGDLDTDGWETIDGKGVTPGPYYLVWTEPQQLPKNGYPWPWQIKSIRLLDFESTYPAIVPLNVAENSVVDHGYRLFRSRCMSCHSMNRQGGNIGPDLNAPRSITDYRSKTFLKAFIRSPARFRYSKMPEFADLSDTDLDDLVCYLKYMSVDNVKSASSRAAYDCP